MRIGKNVRSLVAGLAVALWFALRSFSQTDSFEVAAIRPDNNPNHGECLRLDVHGRFLACHITTEHLILFAFGLRGNQLSGGPAWLRSETFEVNAKIADSDVNRIDQLSGIEQYNAYQRMAKSLLFERFHLRVEESSRELQGYELRVDDGGSKLTPAKGEFGAYVLAGTLSCKYCTLASLSSLLSQTMDSAVFDRTGLAGFYDVSLEWEEARTTSEQELSPNLGSAKPSLREALKDQLGLSLQPKRLPLPSVRILEVSHPDPN